MLGVRGAERRKRVVVDTARGTTRHAPSGELAELAALSDTEGALVEGEPGGGAPSADVSDGGGHQLVLALRRDAEEDGAAFEVKTPTPSAPDHMAERRRVEARRVAGNDNGLDRQVNTEGE